MNPVTSLYLSAREAADELALQHAAQSHNGQWDTVRDGERPYAGHAAITHCNCTLARRYRMVREATVKAEWIVEAYRPSGGY